MISVRVGLVLVIYDDPNGLIRMANKEDLNKFDSIIIIDGKFKWFEGEPEYPHDATWKTVEYLKGLNKLPSVFYEYSKNKTEAEKREISMRMAERAGLDYAIVIDSDEYVKYDPKMFVNELMHYEAHPNGCFNLMLEYTSTFESKRPRIFKMSEKPYYIQYKDGLKASHSSVYSGVTGKELISQTGNDKFVSKAIRLYHNTDYRSEQRKIDGEIYKRLPNV